MASQITTEISEVPIISPKRGEVSTPAQQNTFVVSSETTYDSISENLVPEINAFASEINIVATEVESNKETSVTKASEADTSATDAENSATSSSDSAAASENSRLAAEAILDDFDDKYLGAKASDPTLDNDGDALKSGAIYYNTTTNAMKIYDLELTQWIDVSFIPTSHGSLTGLDDADAHSIGSITNLQTTLDTKASQSATYTKTESDAITDTKIDKTATAQTKLGDLIIGEEVDVASWSYSGSTITVNTSTSHNLSAGQYFSVSGLEATTNVPNGRWEVVSVTDSDTITFTADDTPTGTATVSSAELSHGDIEFRGATLGKNACTAWVNFDGNTTPPTIRDSFNVNDVVRTASGKFEICFEFDMDNINYTIGGTALGSSAVAYMHLVGSTGTDPNNLAKCEVYTIEHDATLINTNVVSIQIFGGKN